MEYVIAVLVLLALVALVVAGPLRSAERDERAESELRDELEAAKEAKYREVREAELDHRMGKLSDEDWRRVDRELRAEAIELLRRVDELG